MPETKLKGVTVNGIPLDSFLEKIDNEKIESDVMDIVRASKTKHIYHHIKTKCSKPNKERNGPVTLISNIEIHKKNKNGYIQQVAGRPRELLVACLISAEKPMSIYAMKKEIELRSDEVPPKSAQLRVHMGYILKSELGIDIVKTFTSGRTRGAEYWLDDKAKQRYSLELACKAAYTMIPQKKRVVDENLNSIKKDKTPPGGDKLKHKPNIEFILTDKNKLPVLEVAGRIDIHFHFHIS